MRILRDIKLVNLIFTHDCVEKKSDLCSMFFALCSYFIPKYHRFSTLRQPNNNQIKQSIQLIGDQALLIRTDQPIAYANALQHQEIAGIVEIVPAIDTVLIIIDPEITSIRQIKTIVRHFAFDSTRSGTQRTITIPVNYDGIDLMDVAQRCGLSVEHVIELHSSATYRVAMIGFLPGFPYLDGLPEALHIPRRAEPRANVAAGSVAIAGSQTGIYPQSSPGGWHILGRTNAIVFDPDCDPPTLLQAGDVIKFEVQSAEDIRHRF